MQWRPDRLPISKLCIGTDNLISCTGFNCLLFTHDFSCFFVVLVSLAREAGIPDYETLPKGILYRKIQEQFNLDRLQRVGKNLSTKNPYYYYFFLKLT